MFGLFKRKEAKEEFNKISVANNNCSNMHSERLKTIEDAIDSDLSTELINGLTASSDAWTISCFDMKIKIAGMYSILFGLGIIFIIIGFLEPKENKKQ